MQTETKQLALAVHRDLEDIEDCEWLEYQLYLVAHERKHGPMSDSVHLDFQEFRSRFRKTKNKPF